MSQQNEYKLSVLRSFGTEQISIAATINASEEEASNKIEKAFDDFNLLIEKSHRKVSDRTDREREFVVGKMKVQANKFKAELLSAGKTEKQANYEVEKAFNIKL